MKKKLALLLCLTMLVSMLAACGSSSSSDTASGTASSSDSSSSSSDDTTITIGYTGGDYPCYPSSTNSEDFLKAGMVYDYLFEVDEDGEYVSRVLESYEWIDEVTLEMTLKDDIYFNDGAQMTMEDVLFSLENMVLQGTATDKYLYYSYIDFDNCVISDDGLTLTLVLTEEYGPFFRELNCAIMQKEFTEAHDDSDEVWYSGPVGSGPYEITDYVEDSYVTFTLRDDYWAADEYDYDATEITLYFYTDETAMYIDYQAGNLDVMYGVSSSTVEEVEADSSIGTVEYIADNDVALLILNEDSEYLSDIAVREAISYAIDYDYIIEVSYGVLGSEATSHLSSASDFYTEHTGYTYDPDKALEILEEAGYSEGDITLTWVSPETSPQPEIGEALQALLAQVGITVEVYSYEFSTALSMYLEGDGVDLAMMNANGGNATGEPEQVFSTLASDASFTAFAIDDEEFNSYNDTGRYNTDEEIRKEAYAEADQWLYDNYLAIPLCEISSAIIYNDRVESFTVSSVNRGMLSAISLY